MSETLSATYTLPSKLALPRYVMGIDPDTRKSGVVVFDTQTRTFVRLVCLDETELSALILSYSPDSILIIVEAGWLNGGTFHGKSTQGWDPQKAKAYGAAIGKSVGRNFEVGFKALAFCQANGYQTDTYRPACPKWKAPFFKRVTKLQKGYNEEIRDAVRAIYAHIQDLL